MVNRELTERNELIVDLLDNSLPPLTLQEVGDMYDISRERVRQIYKNKRGIGATDLMLKRKALAKRIKDQKASIKENTVKFSCAACGDPVMYKDAGRKRKLCSKCSSVLEDQQRDPYITKFCRNCGEPFHPFRNSKYRKPGVRDSTYCNMDCYISSGAFGRRAPKEIGDRNKEIRTKSDLGASPKELSGQYNLSVGRIYTIIRK